MGVFLESEKINQIQFKAESAELSEKARIDGNYKGKARPFCLPVECSEQNLFSGIRDSAITFFRNQGIKWHDGINGKPSNHLCSSQVCCVNFLFPFADKPQALESMLKPIYPDIKRMLQIESGQYVSFEWIGQENYLGERMPRNGKRTRGANYTSADAAVMFENTNGLKQIVLIEWKYTESYSRTSIRAAKSGTDRTKIYNHLYQDDKVLINKVLLPSFESLFYEPFYQFMRQQYLAREMEKAREMNAEIVSVLHIAPKHNYDFQKVTSPELESLATSSIDVWKQLVKMDKRFISSQYESLLEIYQ